MKSVLYCGGYWSTNIGNAFYDLGILYALKQAKPDYQVTFLSDVPEYFWNDGEKGFTLLDKLECDAVVFSGPVFSVNFEKTMGRYFREFHRRGVKIWLLSVGSYRYDDKEKAVCDRLLNECKPDILVSRDTETYHFYRKYARESLSGICFAFYCSDYFKPLTFYNFQKYIVMNFDKGRDYNIIEKYEPGILHYLHKGIPFTASSAELVRKKAAGTITSLSEYSVVRTHHIPNPGIKGFIKQLLFGARSSLKKNSYLSDVPYDYLNIYAGASMTISERVHACVPTIAFGNPAWLISKTKRSRLFDRLNLSEIKNGPVRVDLDLLEKEKQKTIDFLRIVL